MPEAPSRYHLVHKKPIRSMVQTLTPNRKLVLDQITWALSARLNQKLKATFFTSVLIPGSSFWTAFESYWYFFFFFMANQWVYLLLENILYGILTQQCPLLNLLNYFNYFLWDCRRSQIIPEITGFKSTIVLRYETEREIYKKDFLSSSCISYFK